MCSHNLTSEMITYQRWLLTSSTFSLDKFFIFSSILWIHCNISSFFLLILLFFSTKGFSWLSVSRERFSCKWQSNKVSCALVYLWRKREIGVFSLVFLNSESLALLLNGIQHTPLLNYELEQSKQVGCIVCQNTKSGHWILLSAKTYDDP